MNDVVLKTKKNKTTKINKAKINQTKGWMQHVMSSSSIVESPREASQSGHGDALRIVGRSSNLNQGGEGKTSPRDRSTAIDGRSEKTYAAERIKSAPLKTEPIP